MPTPIRSLSIHEARNLISERAFPPVSAERVGLELEWLTRPQIPVEDLRSILSAPLPVGSTITFEPGGQVEISTAVFASCGEAARAAATDEDSVRRTLRAAGIESVGLGLDPRRSERLVTSEERYVAMRAYFDERGPAGARMMSTTAAVHVNVDAGADDEGLSRWTLAHRLGPVLLASFANSPLVYGQPSGWKSARYSAWMDIDPSRTAPVPQRRNHVDAWTEYALAANVMFIRGSERFVPMRDDLPFARWISDGHELGFPAADDLEYHLTTLFPPVRPQGRLELRMIDMLPDPWWRAAAAMTTTLLYDDDAAAAAWEATSQTSDLWTDAARFGLSHPVLAQAAQSCFTAALAALDRSGCDPESIGASAAYFDRFVARGRTPADERVAEFNATGALYPTDQTAEAM
jgi:glutamate--cysteine ligase